MSNVYLRRVTFDDIELLFQWANDPVVRFCSFNSEPILYENHVKWFKRMIEDPTIIQYILMDDDIPVGQIRLNIDGNEAEIGYSVDAKFRGKGYGHKVLKLIAEEVKNNHYGIKSLIAKVKPENMVSNQLFTSEGYILEYSCYSLRIQREEFR